MLRYITIFFLVFTCLPTKAQQELRHTVYFPSGEAKISLAQLDEIKQLVAQAQNLNNAKVVVRAYANDAQGNDSNSRLSGRRAQLMKECLMREGVLVDNIQLERMGASQLPNEPDAAPRADLIITTDQDLFKRQQYQTAIFEQLQAWFPTQYDTFYVNPQYDTLLYTNKGVMLHFPLGAFDTSWADTTVQVVAQSHHQLVNMLVQQLSTLSQEAFLQTYGMLEVRAFVRQQPIFRKLNRPMGVLMPARMYEDAAKLYHTEQVVSNTSHWKNLAADSLTCAAFYESAGYYCNPQNSGKPELPTFGNTPKRPFLANIDSLVDAYDQRIATLTTQIEDLDRQMEGVNERKEEDLYQKLKQKRRSIYWAKKRTEIKKDQAREAHNRAVEQNEATYYRKLSEYNKTRNQQQQAYIKQLHEWTANKDSFSVLCEAERGILADFEQTYGEVALHRVQQMTDEQVFGFWLKTARLGWLNASETYIPDATTTYRVNIKASAYTVAAFLVFKDQATIVMGQPENRNSISFGKLPYDQDVQLVLIRNTDEGLQWHFQETNTNFASDYIDFEDYSRAEAQKQLTIFFR